MFGFFLVVGSAFNDPTCEDLLLFALYWHFPLQTDRATDPATGTTASINYN